MYQTIFKCVTSKKGLNRFFECMMQAAERTEFHRWVKNGAKGWVQGKAEERGRRNWDGKLKRISGEMETWRGKCWKCRGENRGGRRENISSCSLPLCFSLRSSVISTTVTIMAPIHFEFTPLTLWLEHVRHWTDGTLLNLYLVRLMSFVRLL